MVCKHTLCDGLKMRAPKAPSPYGVGPGARSRAPEAKRVLVFPHAFWALSCVPSYCELPCKFCQSHFLVKIMCKHVLWCLREYTPLLDIHCTFLEGHFLKYICTNLQQISQKHNQITIETCGPNAQRYATHTRYTKSKRKAAQNVSKILIGMEWHWNGPGSSYFQPK